VVQLDFESMRGDGRTLRGKLRAMGRRLLVRRDFDVTRLHAGTLWAVLARRVAS
jgi:hypothetical protein